MDKVTEQAERGTDAYFFQKTKLSWDSFKFFIL